MRWRTHDCYPTSAESSAFLMRASRRITLLFAAAEQSINRETTTSVNTINASEIGRDSSTHRVIL